MSIVPKDVDQQVGNTWDYCIAPESLFATSFPGSLVCWEQLNKRSTKTLEPNAIGDSFGE